MYTRCLFTVNPGERRATWEITNKCNLACTYCCHNGNREVEGEELPFNACLRVINELREQRFSRVYITGGEPLLFPHFDEVVSRLCAFAKVIIATSGVELEEVRMDGLRALQNRLSFHVSLNGPNALVHDKMTGREGTYDRTVRNVVSLVKLGYPVRAGHLVSSDSGRNLRAMVHLCEELGIGTLSLSWPVPTGRALRSLPYPPFSITEFLESIVPKLRKTSKYVEISVKRADDGLAVHRDCPGGDELFHIDAQGRVSPCSWLAKMSKRYTAKRGLDRCNVQDAIRSPEIRDFRNAVSRRCADYGPGCPVACLVNAGTINAPDILTVGDAGEIEPGRLDAVRLI